MTKIKRICRRCGQSFIGWPSSRRCEECREKHKAEYMRRYLWLREQSAKRRAWRSEYNRKYQQRPKYKAYMKRYNANRKSGQVSL